MLLSRVKMLHCYILFYRLCIYIFEINGEKRLTLRMSNIGKPARQLRYDSHKPVSQEEELPYSLLLKFLYGEILEELLVLLIRTAGHTVDERQKEHLIDGITGHQDARVDGVLRPGLRPIRHCSGKAGEGMADQGHVVPVGCAIDWRRDS